MSECETSAFHRAVEDKGMDETSCSVSSIQSIAGHIKLNTIEWDNESI